MNPHLALKRPPFAVLLSVIVVAACGEDKPAPASKTSDLTGAEDVMEHKEPGHAEMAEIAPLEGGEAERMGQMEASSPSMGELAEGKKIYTQFCAACHGDGGMGDGPAGAALTPKPRNLADSSYMSTLTDEHLIKVISDGGAAVGLSPVMAPWGAAISEDGIRSVVAFIRSDLCKFQYSGM